MAAIGAHCALCPKCRKVALEVFRVQDAVKARARPYSTVADRKRVAELTGELCAVGSQLWEMGKADLEQRILGKAH